MARRTKKNPTVPSTQEDPDRALEAYERIRAGSRKGAATTKAMIEYAKKNMTDKDLSKEISTIGKQTMRDEHVTH